MIESQNPQSPPKIRWANGSEVRAKVFKFKPGLVVLDLILPDINGVEVCPVLDTIESLFAALPSPFIVRAELRRLFRWLKEKGVTAIITGEQGETTLTRQGLEEYVSDCVIVLDHRLENDISTRRVRVLKYRGSMHGTNAYPFLIDEKGISVMPITSLGLDRPARSLQNQTAL